MKKTWRIETYENGVALALAAKEAGYTVIYKIRHGDTDPWGGLTREYREYFLRQGQLLAKHGLRFEHVLTSGEPRAIGSVLATCQGAGFCPRLHTDNRLRPVEREPGFDKPAFKAEAAELGIKPWVHLNTAPKYSEMIRKAGKDAGKLDMELCSSHAGQIVAQGVHNGYQAEQGIMYLEDWEGWCRQHSEPPKYFDDGQVGVLILDNHGSLVDFFFFPSPVGYFSE